MSKPPAIVTVPINGTAWSLNYEWATATALDNLRAQALNEASQPSVDADVIVYREDLGQPQFGLGSLAAKDRSRAMAAAVAFANALAAQAVQSGIGLFPLPSGAWWLVQVAEDQISPEGDRVFDTLEAAIEAFCQGSRTQKRWARIYAPAEIIREAGVRIDDAGRAGAPPEEFDQFLLGSLGSRGDAPPSPATLAELLVGRIGPKPWVRGARGVDFSWLKPSPRAAVAMASTGVVAILMVTGLWLFWPAPHRRRRRHCRRRRAPSPP